MQYPLFYYLNKLTAQNTSLTVKYRSYIVTECVGP